MPEAEFWQRGNVRRREPFSAAFSGRQRSAPRKIFRSSKPPGNGEPGSRAEHRDPQWATAATAYRRQALAIVSREAQNRPLPQAPVVSRNCRGVFGSQRPAKKALRPSPRATANREAGLKIHRGPQRATVATAYRRQALAIVSMEAQNRPLPQNERPKINGLSSGL